MDTKAKTMKEKILTKRNIAALAVLIAILLCALFACHDKASESKSGGNVVFGMIDSEHLSKDDAQALAESIVEENMFQIFINTDITVDARDMADILVQNTQKNHYSCYVEIVDEDGKRIYESGLIAPGYKVERDEIRGLEQGEHSCTAYFHVLDDDGTEINQVGANVMITKN